MRPTMPHIAGDDNRVPQPVIDVPGEDDERRGEERQEPAEPAVADVVLAGSSTE
jgi:hypothetical protein